MRSGRLVHPLNLERSGVEIKTIRGDYKDSDGVNRNRLRLWEKSDFILKMKRPHRVPLAPQAIAILRDLREITGQGKYLFPSVRSPTRCMSENTINAALRRLGFTKDEMTGHGFRSSASSILNESGLWNADAVERQLAHVDNDSVRRAYARADYWDERICIMAWWADKCEEMQRGAQVIPSRAG